MKPSELINFYGNKTKAAAGIGVSVQTIKNWEKANLIPPLMQAAIQTLTKNKLRAD